MAEQEFVDKFIEKNKKLIENYHLKFFKDKKTYSDLEHVAKLSVIDLLKNNSNNKNIEDLLIYEINQSFKNLYNELKSDGVKEDICPLCEYFGVETFVKKNGYNNSCDVCRSKIKYRNDPYFIFSYYSKYGKKCSSCSRFVPLSYKLINCPYPDCISIIDKDALKKMRNPQSQKCDAEKKTNTQDNSIDLLNKIINGRISSHQYVSRKNNTLHKSLICGAIKSLLKSEQDSFFSYLVGNSRSGGYQSKIFQEYIRLLELEFPLYVQNNNRSFKVESLLDDNLNIFDGISTFYADVDSNGVIHNNTLDMHVNKDKITKFFIGKVLSVTNTKTKECLDNNIDSYSFEKIKTNLPPNTNVTVSHLRLIPSYGLGIMSHINREKNMIKKSFDDREGH